MWLTLAEWFRALDKSNYFENEGDHADEMETSLILHLRPDLVLPKEIWGKGGERKNKIKGFREGWAWMERPWSQVSEDTGIGDPSKATAEKGANYFKDVTQKIAELFLQICQSSKSEIFE
jgi:creatinine amidohydrolase